MWGASIDGKAIFPGGNTADINVDFGTILDHLKMAGMGTFEAQKGRWGAFTDVIYMNLGDTKTTTRDHTIDGVQLPVGVTSNMGLDLKAWVWTLAGSYRVQSSTDSELDVFAGARLLSLEPKLNWNFSADVGPFVGPGRQGSRKVTENDWDAIVGVKVASSSARNANGSFRTTWTSERATRISPGRLLPALVTRTTGAT